WRWEARLGAERQRPCGEGSCGSSGLGGRGPVPYPEGTLKGRSAQGWGAVAEDDSGGDGGGGPGVRGEGHLEGPPPEVVEGDADRREGRCDVLGRRDVVETGDPDVAAGRQAGRPERGLHP